MLVGSDLYWQLTTGEVVRGQTGPVAINTKLGWVLSGPLYADTVDPSTSTVMTVHTLHIHAIAERLNDTLRWELESLGVETLMDSSNDNLSHSIVMKEGKYEVSLPWQESLLPENYNFSLKKLKSLLHRLSHYPDTLQQ